MKKIIFLGVIFILVFSCLIANINAQTVEKWCFIGFNYCENFDQDSNCIHLLPFRDFLSTVWYPDMFILFFESSGKHFEGTVDDGTYNIYKAEEDQVQEFSFTFSDSGASAVGIETITNPWFKRTGELVLGKLSEDPNNIVPFYNASGIWDYSPIETYWDCNDFDIFPGSINIVQDANTTDVIGIVQDANTNGVSVAMNGQLSISAMADGAVYHLLFYEELGEESVTTNVTIILTGSTSGTGLIKQTWNDEACKGGAVVSLAKRVDEQANEGGGTCFITLAGE